MWGQPTEVITKFDIVPLEHSCRQCRQDANRQCGQYYEIRPFGKGIVEALVAMCVTCSFQYLLFHSLRGSPA